MRLGLLETPSQSNMKKMKRIPRGQSIVIAITMKMIQDLLTSYIFDLCSKSQPHFSLNLVESGSSVNNEPTSYQISLIFSNPRYLLSYLLGRVIHSYPTIDDQAIYKMKYINVLFIIIWFLIFCPHFFIASPI
jgi:hypothetical protein